MSPTPTLAQGLHASIMQLPPIAPAFKAPIAFRNASLSPSSARASANRPREMVNNRTCELTKKAEKSGQNVVPGISASRANTLKAPACMRNASWPPTIPRRPCKTRVHKSVFSPNVYNQSDASISSTPGAVALVKVCAPHISTSHSAAGTLSSMPESLPKAAWQRCEAIAATSSDEKPSLLSRHAGLKMAKFSVCASRPSQTFTWLSTST
mmetsp:Transcript_106079/g.298224  ORF Transcript_106079/g.298224 Transcript_106079/m.298224 type:complete len:210 (-) Transcript_106079:1471-2100(-)